MTTNFTLRGSMARTISVVLLLPALQLLLATSATAARPGDYSDYSLARFSHQANRSPLTDHRSRGDRER